MKLVHEAVIKSLNKFIAFYLINNARLGKRKRSNLWLTNLSQGDENYGNTEKLETTPPQKKRKKERFVNFLHWMHSQFFTTCMI